VFVIDKTPAPPGVSSILKAPTKGPFRIEKIEERNATLVDIEDGKTFHSHVELLRPLSLKQYKALLTKNWDFNTHFQKAAKRTVTTRSAFERTTDPLPREEILQTEQMLDMQNLFSETPDTQQHGLPHVEPDEEPPDPLQPLQDGETVDNLEFNSYKVSEEMSQLYRESQKRKFSGKTVSFFG